MTDAAAPAWLNARMSDGDPVFSDDDKQFLIGFIERHPQIGANFKKFLALPEPLRPRFATTYLYHVPRAGWVRRGIPDPESVREHSARLKQLVAAFLDDAESAMPGLKEELPARSRFELIQMAGIHDIPEAIATDFTPHDPVKAEDKSRIESLAAKVIFAYPEFSMNLRLVQEYIDQKTVRSHLLHDFDKIHAVMGALAYETKHPDKTGMFQEFYDYSLARMKTDAGRGFLQDIAANKAGTVAWLRQPNESRTL